MKNARARTRGVLANSFALSYGAPALVQPNALARGAESILMSPFFSRAVARVLLTGMIENLADLCLASTTVDPAHQVRELLTIRNPA